MNNLILNRETFQMPEDGWYQIAPLGEFPHQPTGVVQIVDREACDAMTNAFREESGRANFAGLLIDFDHFSLDDKLKSEAAGWMTELQNRDDGLWAKIRWSDVGEECVKGGRYRFLSPVWSQRDCQDLGNGRLRPIRLLNAAVTNDPNLKGMVPLSNRAESRKQKAEIGTRSGDLEQKVTKVTKLETLPNAEGEPRYKWVLGDSPDDRHCPSCEALAGQVQTMKEWEEAGVKPGGDSLYCKGNCHCSLVKADGTETGTHTAVPLRKGDMNGKEQISNVGWKDAARAASLAVRRAKAAARKAAREAEGKESDRDKAKPPMDPLEGFEKGGLSEMSPEAINEATEQIRKKLNERAPLTQAEEAFLEERIDTGYAGDTDGDPVFEWAERHAMEEVERTREQREHSVEGIHERAEELMTREGDGETLTSEESTFLDRYLEVIGNRHHCRARTQVPMPGHSQEASLIANEGWKDEARAASLAVRRAKAAARREGKRLEAGEEPDREGEDEDVVPGKPQPEPLDRIDKGGMYWIGGTPYFDETTGQYIDPTARPPEGDAERPGPERGLLPKPFPPSSRDPEGTPSDSFKGEGPDWETLARMATDTELARRRLSKRENG